MIPKSVPPSRFSLTRRRVLVWTASTLLTLVLLAAGGIAVLAFEAGIIGRVSVTDMAKTWWRKRQAPPLRVIKPTYESVSYGPEKSQTLDFWKAESEQPTPVIVYIHGGSFMGGDKSRLWSKTDVIERCLNQGVSVVSVNYRFCYQAPLPEILSDATRAIQFLRSQAGEWNLDKARIAAYGDSGGGGLALYAAAHDDVAVPDSPDPVLRESSRVCAVGVLDGQFSYNFPEWEAVVGPYPDPTRKPKWELYYWLLPGADPNAPEVQAQLAECDLRALLTPDDPPLFLFASLKFGTPTSHYHFLHHPQHAVTLHERCEQVGIESELVLMDSPRKPVKKRNELVLDFLLRQLEMF